MTGSFSIGLSGLQAAQTRLTIAASNIANINTAGHTAKGALEAGDNVQEPYQAVSALATSTAGGGVTVSPVPVDPTTVTVFSPSNPLADSEGFIAVPNLSFAEQMVELKIAALSYKANVKVIEAESDLTGTLLDSFS